MVIHNKNCPVNGHTRCCSTCTRAFLLELASPVIRNDPIGVRLMLFFKMTRFERIGPVLVPFLLLRLMKKSRKTLIYVEPLSQSRHRRQTFSISMFLATEATSPSISSPAVLSNWRHPVCLNRMEPWRPPSSGGGTARQMSQREMKNLRLHPTIADSGDDNSWPDWSEWTGLGRAWRQRSLENTGGSSQRRTGRISEAAISSRAGTKKPHVFGCRTNLICIRQCLRG